MKIKTNELIGPALNWAVAKAEGVSVDLCILPESTYLLRNPLGSGRWRPSTDWAQGGPIIEREKISVIHHDDRWRATNGDSVVEEAFAFTKQVKVPHPTCSWRWADAPGQVDVFGPTPLIAAMRCFVASRLGEEIDIPEELAP